MLLYLDLLNTFLHVLVVWLSGITLAKSFTVICIDYWNNSYSAGPYQIPTLAQAVPTEHHHLNSPPSLAPIHSRMPSLPPPSSFDHHLVDNHSPDPTYPVDGSNERIARLRTELQGVRTGIQRIVSGLQDLNETTHQQELAAQASLHSFNMSGRSTERSPPGGPRAVLQGNLESSAWSNIPGPHPFHNPLTARSPPHSDPARPRLSGQDPLLRVRQRAYLESDQQHQPPIGYGTASGTATHTSHRTPARQNPFQALGTREEVERPDYQSPVTNLYVGAWGDYRNAEAARQSQNPSASNGLPTNGSHQPITPNPLVNPSVRARYPLPYFATPPPSGPSPYLNSMGLQGIPATDLTPPMRYPQIETSGGALNRWPLHHLAPSAGNRRFQNLSAPDRAAEPPDSTSSNRRTIDASRRAAHRAEAERGIFLRSLELSGGDLAVARAAFPYALSAGLNRDHYTGTYQGRESGSETESEPSLTFDTQNRPPPMDAESMMLDMACSICKEHLVDTVVLPCGHAVMCNWCADLHVPSRKQDHTIPRDRLVKCPMCRSRIKQKVRLSLVPGRFLGSALTEIVQNLSFMRLALVCEWTTMLIQACCNSQQQAGMAERYHRKMVFSVIVIWNGDHGRLGVATLSISSLFSGTEYVL